MGSNQELLRIQEWMGNWYGGKECPLSMEDVRNLCRGPMRHVLLDFLVPQFRTDEQIKVIRSNLFLNDLAQRSCEGEVEPPSRFDQHMNNLKGKLTEVHLEKIQTVERIKEHQKKIDEAKQNSQTKLVNLACHYEKCEARAQLVRDRVVSASVLIQDLNNAKPTFGPPANPPTQSATAGVSASGSEDSPSMGGDALLHLTQLKALCNNASDLFDLFLLPNSPVNSGSRRSQSNSTPEVQALTMAVSKQTTDLVHSGLPPATLEKWTKCEQDISTHKVKAMSTKFSNVMNPLEELQNETKAIYTKLMSVHVDLHLRNKDMRSKLRCLKDHNMLRIKESILNDPSIIPENFLSLIKKEEQSEQLAKCRELTKQLKQIESACNNNEDEDMLALLCEEASENLVEEKETGDTGSTARAPLRASLGSLDGNGSFSKQEALEDVTCSLLKSIPISYKQLETTIQQSKNLVLDRFPKILSRDNADNDRKLFDAPTGIGAWTISSDDMKIKIPKQFIPNHDLLMNPPPGQNCDDLLSEVFRMQQVLETRKQQSEAMLRQRRSFESGEL